MERLYVLLNEEGQPAAKAALESPLDAEVFQFRLVGTHEDVLADLEQVKMVGSEEGSPDFAGVIERRRGERFTVRPTAPLDQSARKNLRMETHFNSLIYPVSGSWKGQRMVRGADLSCGGVAFYCVQPLEVDEIVELVLPVTDEPLILKVQIMRVMKKPDNPIPLYAARFVEMIHDEEALVRKAVFGIQIASAR